MADFQFVLGDLVSNDTSNSNSNPFYREFMKGKTTPPTTSAAFSTTAKGGGQTYDAYAGTSALSLSDVMMNTPLQNDPNKTLGTQESLIDTLVQGALGKAGGALGIFDALIPSDTLLTSAVTQAKNNPQSNQGGNAAYNNPSSSGGGQAGWGTNSPPGGLPMGDKAPPTTGVPVANFVNLALQQVGKTYVFGAVGPNVFDCSGLVLYCLQQLGIRFPHYTGSQYDTIKTAGTDCSVEEAINMYGALLFIGSSASSPADDHVAISLGNGSDVEATHTGSYVLKLGGTSSRGWTAAGFIPGLDYSQVTYGQGLSSLPVKSPGNKAQ